ncbi:MAG TPA: hypothetical protein VHO46_08400 [Bacteroidales bacterium]|nr:hypothetical protein [Bacteroidales bacterium]
MKRALLYLVLVSGIILGSCSTSKDVRTTERDDGTVIKRERRIDDDGVVIKKKKRDRRDGDNDKTELRIKKEKNDRDRDEPAVIIEKDR